MNSVKDEVAGRKPAIVIALGEGDGEGEDQPMQCPMCKNCPAMQAYKPGGEDE